MKVMQSKHEYRGKMSLIARNENLECVMYFAICMFKPPDNGLVQCSINGNHE